MTCRKAATRALGVVGDRSQIRRDHSPEAVAPSLTPKRHSLRSLPTSAFGSGNFHTWKPLLTRGRPTQSWRIGYEIPSRKLALRRQGSGQSLKDPLGRPRPYHASHPGSSNFCRRRSVPEPHSWNLPSGTLLRRPAIHDGAPGPRSVIVAAPSWPPFRHRAVRGCDAS